MAQKLKKNAGIKSGKKPIWRLTSDRRRKFIEKTGLDCFWCGNMCTPIPRGTQSGGLEEHHATVDHLHPISQGGRNTQDNLVVCCQRCNRMRGNLTVEEFVAFSSMVRANMNRTAARIFVSD